MIDLVEIIRKTLAEVSDLKLWVAVSGGLDSAALLYVCAQLKQKGIVSQFEIVYVDHQLHDDSAQWGSQVLKWASSYGLSSRVIPIKLNKKTQIEELAREKRYRAIFALMGKDDILLTGHHLDDQLETYLFRSLRGTGLRGLLGMKSLSHLYGYRVLRPMLSIPRSDIKEYALAHGIEWVEDPSNQDSYFSRNQIRQALSLIPHRHDIRLTLEHLRRQFGLLEDSLSTQLGKISPQTHIVDLDQLSALSLDWQHELFHYWVLMITGQSQSHTASHAIYASMKSAKEDRYPSYRMGDFHLLRYRSMMTLIQLPSSSLDLTSSDTQISLEAFGTIMNPQGRSLRILSFEKSNLSLGRYKKQFQELGIPSWLRPHIPCVFDGNLICVGPIDRQNTQVDWLCPSDWTYWLP